MDKGFNILLPVNVIHNSYPENFINNIKKIKITENDTSFWEILETTFFSLDNSADIDSTPLDNLVEIEFFFFDKFIFYVILFDV